MFQSVIFKFDLLLTMPTFLLQLLALTLSALSERLARELDEEFGNYDLGAALDGPALCQEKKTFDEKSCLKKKTPVLCEKVRSKSEL